MIISPAEANPNPSTENTEQNRHRKLRLSIDHLAIVYLLLAWPPLYWSSLCYKTLNENLIPALK